MLKGVNKRVIIIKNPESEIFEEVYFIVKNKSLFRRAKENEMAIEANRIIADYSKQQKISAGFAAESKNNKAKNSPGSQKSKPAKKPPNSITTAADEHSVTGGVEDIEDDFLDDIYFLTESPSKPYSSSSFDIAPTKVRSDSAFEFVSSKKLKGVRGGHWRARGFQAPPKSFFVGIGVMSAVIIAARVIEFIVR